MWKHGRKQSHGAVRICVLDVKFDKSYEIIFFPFNGKEIGEIDHKLSFGEIDHNYPGKQLTKTSQGAGESLPRRGSWGRDVFLASDKVLVTSSQGSPAGAPPATPHMAYCTFSY